MHGAQRVHGLRAVHNACKMVTTCPQYAADCKANDACDSITTRATVCMHNLASLCQAARHGKQAVRCGGAAMRRCEQEKAGAGTNRQALVYTCTNRQALALQVALHRCGPAEAHPDVQRLCCACICAVLRARLEKHRWQYWHGCKCSRMHAGIGGRSRAATLTSTARHPICMQTNATCTAQLASWAGAPAQVAGALISPLHVSRFPARDAVSSHACECPLRVMCSHDGGAKSSQHHALHCTALCCAVLREAALRTARTMEACS
jgi:hypothetical protein